MKGRLKKASAIETIVGYVMYPTPHSTALVINSFVDVFMGYF